MSDPDARFRRINTVFDEEQARRLRELAEDWGVSMSALVRMAVQEFLWGLDPDMDAPRLGGPEANPRGTKPTEWL